MQTVKKLPKKVAEKKAAEAAAKLKQKPLTLLLKKHLLLKLLKLLLKHNSNFTSKRTAPLIYIGEFFYALIRGIKGSLSHLPKVR